MTNKKMMIFLAFVMLCMAQKSQTTMSDYAQAAMNAGGAVAQTAGQAAMSTGRAMQGLGEGIVEATQYNYLVTNNTGDHINVVFSYYGCKDYKMMVRSDAGVDARIALPASKTLCKLREIRVYPADIKKQRITRTGVIASKALGLIGWKNNRITVDKVTDVQGKQSYSVKISE